GIHAGDRADPCQGVLASPTAIRGTAILSLLLGIIETPRLQYTQRVAAHDRDFFAFAATLIPFYVSLVLSLHSHWVEELDRSAGDSAHLAREHGPGGQEVAHQWILSGGCWPLAVLRLALPAKLAAYGQALE